MPVLKMEALAVFIVTISKALLRNGNKLCAWKKKWKTKGLYLKDWLRSGRLGKLIPIYS